MEDIVNRVRVKTGGNGKIYVTIIGESKNIKLVEFHGEEYGIVQIAKAMLNEAKGIEAKVVLASMLGQNIGNKAYTIEVDGLPLYIPSRMMPAIKRYIDEHKEPGHFLQAVICNDLMEAHAKADDENMRNLKAFVSYFYNEAPSTCWGSKKKMKAWVAMKKED